MSWSFYGFWSRVIDAFHWFLNEVESWFIRVQNSLLYPIRWGETVLHRRFGVPMDYARPALAVTALLVCAITAAVVLLIVKLRERK